MNTYFAYADDLGSMRAAPGATVLGFGVLRGCAFEFVKAPDRAAARLSIRGIRGDACIPGVLYSVDDACLADLLASAAMAGYEAFQISIERGRHGLRAGPDQVVAWTLKQPGQFARTPPDDAEVARLRTLMTEAGLDLSAFELALTHGR